MEVVRGFVDNKLIGAVLLAKHAMRRLWRGGSMTFFGHNKDRPPVPGGAVAAAIAGSFSYFARDLSLELAPTRVNVVSPGWVDTPMFDELIGEAKARLLRDPSRPLAGGKDRDTSGHRPRLHLRHGKRLHVWRDHSHRRRQPPFLQVTKGRPAAHRLHRLSFLSGHQGMVRGEWRWPEGRPGALPGPTQQAV
jgi:NAD(P)-dependent dehydrogenase (short-subunit alcohol dehydrogenase family)